MLRNKIKLCALIILCHGLVYANDEKKADMVIFSFNRPLQLYALLESIEEFVTDVGTLSVIYRASSQPFSIAYDELKQRFSHVSFVPQGSRPFEDFKVLTLQAAFKSPHDYVIFAVDDIIVTDHVSLLQCIEMLELRKAYGFFLRLGKNLSECYALNSAQALPAMQEVGDGICAWQFVQGQGDWCYPNTVDMTLYRKKDIVTDFCAANYKAPYSLEASWSSRGRPMLQYYGLCFEHSKIVNLPLNIVQNEGWVNRSMNFLTPEQMLEIFNEGKKIDRKPLFKIDNKAAHMAYEPTFVERS